MPWSASSTHTPQPAWPLAQLAPPADSGYCRDGAIHVTTRKIGSQLVSQTLVGNFLLPSLPCVSREEIIVSGGRYYYPPFTGGETEGQSWGGAASPSRTGILPPARGELDSRAPSLNSSALAARREITAP